MDFSLTEEQMTIRKTVREFARKEIKPVAVVYDKKVDPKDCFPWELLKKASALGLRTCAAPKKWGGDDTDMLTRVIICEEMGSGDAGFSTVIGGMMKACHMLGLYLNEKQQEEFFPKIMKDDMYLIATAVTEPDSSTDIHLPFDEPGVAMKTFAYKDGNEYVINGVKHFITGGGVSKLYIVYVRTDKTKPVSQAVSGFLVPIETPGFQVAGFHDMLGKRLQGQAELVFQDVRVPARYLIGEENKMFSTRMEVWAESILTTLAAGLGEARTCYEETKDYAAIRVQGGKPIIEHPNIGCRIVDMYFNIEAARTLLWKIAWSWDTREDYDPQMVYLTKAFVNEAVLKVIEDAMEVYAGWGAQKEMPVEKHLRNAWNALHGGSTPTVNRLKAMKLLLKSIPKQ
jgi:alkylation response protein AidB-like acyl-CoA dehydrogenase